MRVISEREYKVVELGAMYLSRPQCHAGEPMRMKLLENTLALGLPELVESAVVARMLMAFNHGPKRRKELFDEALDLIELCRDEPELVQEILGGG